MLVGKTREECPRDPVGTNLEKQLKAIKQLEAIVPNQILFLFMRCHRFQKHCWVY